jgi:hypothetical protein
MSKQAGTFHLALYRVSAGDGQTRDTIFLTKIPRFIARQFNAKPVTVCDQSPETSPMSSAEPLERITQAILVVRGHRVILDADLADLYGVTVKRLLEAVRRNHNRFPADFMFQLDKQEVANLRSQFATSRWGGRRYTPCAFTEQGVAMLSSVLRSERAVLVNIEIMRAFVRLRRILASNVELARKLNALEAKYDTQFKVVFDTIRELMGSPDRGPKRRIGFISPDEG